MYFRFFSLHFRRKRSAAQPQMIDSEFLWKESHRLGFTGLWESCCEVYFL